MSLPPGLHSSQDGSDIVVDRGGRQAGRCGVRAPGAALRGGRGRVAAGTGRNRVPARGERGAGVAGRRQGGGGGGSAVPRALRPLRLPPLPVLSKPGPCARASWRHGSGGAGAACCLRAVRLPLLSVLASDAAAAPAGLRITKCQALHSTRRSLLKSCKLCIRCEWRLAHV